MNIMPAQTSRHLDLTLSGPITNDAQRRRKNVGTACSACKSRKLKCSGVPPCDNCVKSRVECALDETADKRRRGALKRKIDQLEEKEHLLLRLLEYLRKSPDSLTIPLLNLIRSNASPAEVRFYIEHELPRSESSQIPDLLDMHVELGQHKVPEPPLKRRDYGIRKDNPRFKVPARPWTTITANDGIVSELISLWFTWVHPFCNFIDRDLFIRDMKSGSAPSTFCSSFLVNTILAEACIYSDCSSAGLLSRVSLMQVRFYEEAQRALDKEEGRISLPTVQGLGVLWMSALITGRKRQAWIRGGQLAYSLGELFQMSSNRLVTAESDTIPLSQVIEHTKLGLSNMAMMDAAYAKRAPLVPPPDVPPPFTLHCEEDEWYNYPTGSHIVQSHTSCLFNAVCHLHHITYKVGPISFSQEAASVAEAKKFGSEKLAALQELSDWPSTLPECLQATNVDAPHILSLHVHYQSIMMSIYKVFRIHPLSVSKLPDLSTNIREAITSPKRAWEACLSSARQLAQLTLVHRSNWGCDRMSPANLPGIMVALYVLLEALEEPVNRDGFTSLVVALGAYTRRCEITKFLLRNLKNTAREREAVLPPEIGAFFVDLELVPNNPTK
ncbi:hypothetical protein BDV18DRAFT_142404 [Aspergillus unguis]